MGERERTDDEPVPLRRNARRRTPFLPVDVRLTLVRGDRAEDDVHLLEGAALSLRDEPIGSPSVSVDRKNRHSYVGRTMRRWPYHRC